MHDDRHDGEQEKPLHQSGAERDALGALISAAGRRPVPPDDAYDQVRAAAHEAWQGQLRVRRQRRWMVALAATLAGLAVGVSLVVQLVSPETAQPVASTRIIQGEVLVQRPGEDNWEALQSVADPIVAGTRLRATTNGRLALTLIDDASLRIDANTTVAVTTAREIDLITGTLYLDAGADDATEPFSVTSPLGTVRDIGTQFEVAMLDGALRVRVREGAIALGAATGIVMGSAGEQISMRVDGAIERSQFSPFDPDWGWVETLAGTPEVEGQSLLLFLSWVARETGYELRFDAPDTETRARTVILHGNAEDLLPLQALDVMLSTTDFDYTLSDEGVILVRPRTALP